MNEFFMYAWGIFVISCSLLILAFTASVVLEVIKDYVRFFK
jgi:hypothetical protein